MGWTQDLRQVAPRNGGPYGADMSRLRIPTERRPGLRAFVLSVSGALVVGTALIVSQNVSDHVSVTAVNEAVRTTEAVVRGSLDTLVDGPALSDPSSARANAINDALQRLVDTGNILRIKVWSLDGTVLFSDLAALRGRNLGVADHLEEVFQG